MIHAVRCDKKSFQDIEFQAGMNVVLAERTNVSTKKDSRNGLGKTTLIEIIHFCLGSSANTTSPLIQGPLENWTFFLDIDFRGKRYIVSRNTSSPRKIFVEGDMADWPMKPARDSKTGERYISLSNWNELLGWLVFELPVENVDTKYSPQFRSLISYFIRRGRDAFTTPFEHFRKQLEWDKQVHNLFLLGLDWEFASQWQILKDQENALKSIKQAANAGLVPNLIGTIGELETAKVRAVERVENLGKQLGSFQVHPQYQEIEEQANALTVEIHGLTNENVYDGTLLDYYQSSFQNDVPADVKSVVNIYDEIGVALPSQVVRRLDEVLEFHRRITTNRESFLQTEIDKLKNAIRGRNERIKQASEERASLMSILQTHGALEEYTRLQQKLTEEVSRLEEINNQINSLKKFEQGKSSVRIEKERLQLNARADYFERKTAREKAISFFNANSEALYMVPGKLIIDVGPNGFKFQVEIERSGSQGIEQMKVFCYDLMLAQMWSQKAVAPGFLIHDSTIFDGVDERQVAHALELAAYDAKNYGFQYICCLNSDTIPSDDFSSDFNLQQYVRKVLTDATPDGGLLGLRY